MTSGEIDYPELVDDALRTVARRVLARVAEEGLPGDHHFLITFYTDHPDIQLPAALRDTYPEEMTIVLQNQFWGLEVEEEAFAVSVRFGGDPQRLRVPWRALKSFVDPGAEFGLRFESHGPETDDSDSGDEPADLPDEPGEVISLDEFRNRDS
jgi:hypothetical protein